MAKKKKVRRVQYFPEMVVAKVLGSSLLRTLAYLVYTAKTPVSAGELSRMVSRVLGREYSPGYVSVYLKHLEKWGVVRAFRNPVNGHLLWWRADTKTAELIGEELQKSELRKILQLVEEI